MKIDYDEISESILSKKLQLIGVGSSRSVYDLKNGYVVKMARNKKGLAQNRAEHKIAARNRSFLFADVISVSDDYIYLIMKKADKIGSLDPVRKYYKVKSLKELFKRDDIRKLIRDNDLLLPDLYRKTSWGIINERPVLVDYGFTKEVRKYYRLF